MKNWIQIILLATTAILGGCETTPFERGVIAGEGAKAIFDAPQDEAKFQKVKADIVAVLKTDRPITAGLVDAYVKNIQSEFSPAFIAIVQRRLESELPAVNVVGLGKIDDTRIREFLAGLAAVL